MLKTNLLCALLAAVVLGSMLPRSARAQTGAELLVRPWPEDQFIDASANGFWLNSAHSDNGPSIQLSEYESSGRIRIMPGNIISPRIGYDFKFLDVGGNNTTIPHNLSDESIAFGTAVGKFEDWVAGLTLGVGYAGNSAFSRGSGWYGKATFAIGKKLNETDGLGIVFDYDGNRAYFPEIPLPGFIYQKRIDPTLLLGLGVPYSSVEWKPIEHLTLEGSYTLVSQFTARASYEVVKHVNVYGSFDNVEDAFHINGLPKNKRLLFEQHRLEAGVQYVPTDHVRLIAAVGYAFSNRFLTGYDFERTRTVDHFASSPYVHAGLEVKF